MPQSISAEGNFLSSGNLYGNINLQSPFTGTIVAEDGFIHERSVHISLHPVWKFEIELEISCENISKQMETLRKKLRMKSIRSIFDE